MNQDIPRTTAGIRQMMFDELIACRRGESLPSRTNAISRAVSQILASAKLEIDHAKLKYLLGRNGDQAHISAVEL